MKCPVKVDRKAVITVIATGNGLYETPSDQEENKAENRAATTSDDQVPQANRTTQTNNKPRRDPEIVYVPPTHQDSYFLKQGDLPPICQSSTLSKPEVVLDRITTVESDQSSVQASASK